MIWNRLSCDNGFPLDSLWFWLTEFYYCFYMRNVIALFHTPHISTPGSTVRALDCFDFGLHYFFCCFFSPTEQIADVILFAIIRLDGSFRCGFQAQMLHFATTLSYKVRFCHLCTCVRVCVFALFHVLCALRMHQCFKSALEIERL